MNHTSKMLWSCRVCGCVAPNRDELCRRCSGRLDEFVSSERERKKNILLGLGALIIGGTIFTLAVIYRKVVG